MTALIGGQIDFAIAELGAALPTVGPEGLKILSATSERRMPDLLEVPTIQELGYANYGGLVGPFCSERNPGSREATLEQARPKIYGDTETKEFLDKNNFSTFVANLAELRRFKRLRFSAKRSSSNNSTFRGYNRSHRNNSPT